MYVFRNKVVDLSWNQLDGKIPEEIGNSSSLVTMDLRRNGFITGSIPLGIFNLSSLAKNDVSGNMVSGKLPDDMCDNHNMRKLKFVSVGSNRIEGRIPPSIWKCTQLERLHLSNNNFSGEIPNEIGRLSMLTRLYLDSNRLQGTINISLIPFLEVRKLLSCRFLIAIVLKRSLSKFN